MSAARFSSLDAWLHWQEGLHPKTIDLGLERVRQVAQTLGVLQPAPIVVSVGGTNGKGSAVALLEAVLRAAGYATGAYFSPHLLRYNERMRIDGVMVDDDALCQAFAAVDQARRGISLTYFEFGTLAALWLFRRAAVDVALLEVGLGGRLDAVNVVDADAAIVTSVGLDHTQWLGPDRDSIGREKAGIFRTARPAVCGEVHPPQGLLDAGHSLGTDLRLRGRDFHATADAQGWDWRGRHRDWPELPLPTLRGRAQIDNAAAVLAALESLRGRLRVNRDAVAEGLRQVHLPGRLQMLDARVPVLFDVAHNAEAAAVLADYLRQAPVAGSNLAVVGMLADKPADTVAQVLDGCIEHWYAGGLDGERGLGGAALGRRLGPVQGAVRTFDDVNAAFRQAWSDAGSSDRVVVLGSFRTVAAVSESARWMKS